MRGKITGKLSHRGWRLDGNLFWRRHRRRIRGARGRWRAGRDNRGSVGPRWRPQVWIRGGDWIQRESSPLWHIAREEARFRRQWQVLGGVRFWVAATLESERVGLGAHRRGRLRGSPWRWKEWEK